MSEENVEFARRLIDNFNAFMRGELSNGAYTEPFHQQVDVHWHDQQTYPDTPQHLRGPEDLIAFTREYRDGWSELRGEALELVDAPGDTVFGLIRQTGLGRQSGVPIEIHYFQIWRFEDGKVREIEMFRHRADALEAAGLQE
jgi:ketosteroid isomerase-like protein